MQLTCVTDYPFNESIAITVTPAREATFPLSFRIPGWCEKPALAVNGTAVKVSPDANGFVRIERRWRPADTVRLQFPMQPRVATGVDRNAYDKIKRHTDAIPPTTGTAPYATVSYGPLLFALPIAETKDANTPDPAAPWRFALETTGKKPGADITVERRPMPERWTWPLDAPLKLHAQAVPFDWNPTDHQPLPPQPVSTSAPAQRITLIPYGCAKFRVSMFPVRRADDEK